MKLWQVLLVIVLMFILFRATDTKEGMYTNPDRVEINQGSIDSLYVEPHIRTAEIFLYESPSERCPKNLTYSYLGSPNPDYYPDRVPNYSQPVYQGRTPCR